MVEVARLESVYRFIAYRGFESPSLRQGFMRLPDGSRFHLYYSDDLYYLFLLLIVNPC